MVTLRERFHERFGDEPLDGKFDSDEELAPLTLSSDSKPSRPR
jgi:hypothetical protein